MVLSAGSTPHWVGSVFAVDPFYLWDRPRADASVIRDLAKFNSVDTLAKTDNGCLILENNLSVLVRNCRFIANHHLKLTWRMPNNLPAPAEVILRKIRRRFKQHRVKVQSLNAYGDNAADELRGLLNGNRSPTEGNLAAIADAFWGLAQKPEAAQESPKHVAALWDSCCLDLRSLAPAKLPSVIDAQVWKSVFYTVCGFVADDEDLSLRKMLDHEGKRLSNPFTWRGGISDEQGFFGREDRLRKLRDYLRTRSNVQIVGPRRIGKTSLLYAVGRQVKDWMSDPAFAFVDMAMANCQTLEGWLRCVAREWQWAEPPDNLPKFADRVQVDLRTGRQLVLCLDEFEQFAELSGEFTTDFFDNLRACGQKGVSILTAARLSLREIRESGALLSPYYNTFARLDLGPFTDAEAKAFISRARPDVPMFTTEESKQILRSANGHPLRLVIACYEVLEARETGEALSDIIQRAERHSEELLPMFST